jgi:hypothetical protein
MSRVIKISVQNTDAVQKALRQFGEKAENEIEKAVVLTALKVHDDVKEAIKSPVKTGHLYYRIPGNEYMTIRQGSEDGPIVAVFRASGKQNLSLTHRASAPGEAPANDTGLLFSSIYFKQPSKLTAEIGSRLPYAYWLEYGTKKIKPRPSWVPATQKNIPLFQKLVDAALRRAAQ